jgi:NADH dehydrogenase FAD-containing subunit
VAQDVVIAGGGFGGRYAARFRYRTLGVFVDMGQHQAVAQMLDVPLRGFPAWFAAAPTT